MMLSLMLALGLAAQAGDPPVQVWLNHNDYARGDRAKVYVRAQQDGYLVVLRADADGRLRMLYPLDPGDDNFVRGGDEREIRGRGDREAFWVEESSGSGAVLAAVSHDPFKFDQFVRGDHWDYRVLREQRVSDDPEAGLLDVVRQMAGGGGAAHFDYDVATYTVESSDRYRSYSSNYYSYYDPFGYTCFGCGYYPYRRYGFGVGFGYGYYDPFFYDPFFDPFYYGSYAFYYPRSYYYPFGFYYPRRTVFYPGRFAFADPQAASRRWNTIHRPGGPPFELAGRRTRVGTTPTIAPAVPRWREPMARPSQQRSDPPPAAPRPIWARPRTTGDRVASPPPARQSEARPQPERRDSPRPIWDRPRSGENSRPMWSPPQRQPEARPQPERRESPRPIWDRPRSNSGGGGGGGMRAAPPPSSRGGWSGGGGGGGRSSGGSGGGGGGGSRPSNNGGRRH